MEKRSNSSFRDKITRNIKRQKESKSGFGYLNLPKDVKMLILEENTREIELDFLPYIVTDPNHPDRDEQFGDAMPGTEWYRRPFKVHRTDNDTFICLRSIGKKCPICEYREKLKREGADKEDIRVLYPKRRSLYVVVPIGMKKYDEIPTVWDMSDYLFQDVLNDELEIDEENRAFPDLQYGKTLILRLRWKELGKNNYPEVGSIRFSDRDPYPEKVMKEVPELDKLLKILTYEELEQKFFTGEIEPDAGKLEEVDEYVEKRRIKRAAEEDDEEDERTERRSIRGKKRMEEEEVESKTEDDEQEERRVERRGRVKKESVRREPDASNRRRKSEKEAVACPSGFKFGEDFEKYEECEDCAVWNECYDENKKGKR